MSYYGTGTLLNVPPTGLFALTLLQLCEIALIISISQLRLSKAEQKTMLHKQSGGARTGTSVLLLGVLKTGGGLGCVLQW